MAAKEKRIPVAVRAIDDLGRIVLPKDLRDRLGLNNGDIVEIETQGSKVILGKYQPGCTNCDNTDVELFGQARICRECLDSLSKENVSNRGAYDGETDR